MFIQSVVVTERVIMYHTLPRLKCKFIASVFHILFEFCISDNVNSNVKQMKISNKYFKKLQKISIIQFFERTCRSELFRRKFHILQFLPGSRSREFISPRIPRATRVCTLFQNLVNMGLDQICSLQL